MGPKKVWGIVLVVVGVIAVIGGLSRYHSTAFYGNEIMSMNAAVAPELKKMGLDKYFNTDYEALIKKEKTISIISVLLGITFSILGTLMIKNKTQHIDSDFGNADYPDHTNGPRFKL